MNIVPQPENSGGSVVVSSNMTVSEARRCIGQIKQHLKSVRLLLLELESRRGWSALGYKSMRQCMVTEFGRSQSQLYRELKAAKIERKISPRGEIGLIPEKHLRHIGKLPPEKWSSAWIEVEKTAPDKGVTTNHVAKTIARIKKELSQVKDKQEFVLGEWVEVRTRYGNKAWDGMRGAVIKVEQYEITVGFDDYKHQYLRFYRDELVKVEPPNSEVVRVIKVAGIDNENQSLSSCEDLVIIDCQKGADLKQRLHNGCWGRVVSVGNGSVEVTVKGKGIWYMNGDVTKVDSPIPQLKEIGEKLERLFCREDLDELDRHILEFYVRRLTFTDRQLDRLAQVWKTYNL